MNDETRRTPSVPEGEERNDAVKDKYQLAFEEQLRQFNEMAGDGDDYSPFDDPDLQIHLCECMGAEKDRLSWSRFAQDLTQFAASLP